MPFNINYKLDNKDIGNVVVSKGDIMEIYSEIDDAYKQPALFMYGYLESGTSGRNVGLLSVSSPVQVSTYGWKSISVHYTSVFGIKTDGTLWGWGENASTGVLGVGDRIDRSSPTQVVGGGNWKQVNNDSSTSIGIKSDGTLWGWGYNDGRIPANIASTNYPSSPVQIGSNNNWKSLPTQRMATYHALKEDGTLWGWGFTTYGRLFNQVTSVSSPIQLGANTNWKLISAAYETFAGIQNDGTLWTWGYTNGGAIGNYTAGGVQGVSSPVQTVAGGTNWKYVTGATFTNTFFAIKNDGTLWGWGVNSINKELGRGDITGNVSSPTQIAPNSTSNWVKVASTSAGGVGSNLTSIGLKADGTLWTWGFPITDPTGLSGSTEPEQTIATANNYMDISIGYRKIAFLEDESVDFFGNNIY